MGNGESHFKLEGDAKRQIERFDTLELKVIKETFKDLSHISGGERCIDKETFLQYFHLPGLIGRRLFAAFDKRNEGFIRYEDFITSLGVLCRGTWKEKAEFIYKLYDVNNSNTITKKQLLALINHVPKDVIALYWDQRTIQSKYQQFYEKRRKHDVSCESITINTDTSDMSGQNKSVVSWSSHIDKVLDGEENCKTEIEDSEDGGRHDSSDECKFNNHTLTPAVTQTELPYHEYSHGLTNAEIVSQAFEECDLGRNNCLTFGEFELWMERNPIMITFLQTVFPYDGNREWDGDNKHLPFVHNRIFDSHGSSGWRISTTKGTSQINGGNEDLSIQMGEGEDFSHEETKKLLLLISKITSHEGIRNEIPKLIALLGEPAAAPSTDTDNIVTLSSAASHYRSSESNNSGDMTSTGAIGKHQSSATVSNARTRHMKTSNTLGRITCRNNRPNTIIPNKNTTNLVPDRSMNMPQLNLEGYCSAYTSQPLLSATTHGPMWFQQQNSHIMHNNVITKEGWLIKKGQRLRGLKRRWFVLLGNCAYYYTAEDKTPLRGVMFLCGNFVEPVNSYSDERRGYWGFEISRKVNGKECTRLFYAKSKADRDDWVFNLREASEAIPIEEDYHIGQVLGKGRSSRVCICVNKKTLQRMAVKIIDKALMDDDERELVRSEIAIMKLIYHPNIVRMHSIYEGKHQIYIVMELYESGELFDRIVGHSCFTEDEAYQIMRPLTEALEYLHDMGIIHRDLKPENILCGNSMMDVKIADFGLSKLIYPDEIMKLPCGTLSYVAPEVLTLSGYGMEADIWSVGIILYLLLCGGLPFDGETRKEIISKTIAAKLDPSNPGWQSLSPNCQDLLLGMLSRDMKKRLTATEILNHPWMSSRM